MVFNRRGQAWHVREDLVTAADLGDDPEEVAVREAPPVELPALVEVGSRRATRGELGEIVADQLAFVGSAVFDRQRGSARWYATSWAQLPVWIVSKSKKQPRSCASR